MARPLAADLGLFVSGKMHDELSWKDVAIHACRVLQTNEKVVFITLWQVGRATMEYAKHDGYRPVIVPEDIARALGPPTDLDGQPMFDLGAYQTRWNDSFTFTFIESDGLSKSEQAIYALAEPACKLAGVKPSKCGVRAIKISETMRLGEEGDQVLGVFDPSTGYVVIRRDQLATPSAFCGTLLHELEHATSGAA